MVVETGRFGQLVISEKELIRFPQGLVGFPKFNQFCLVDPMDDTLVLWLQSIDEPGIAFPVLEPKIFKPDYTVRLSQSELRELQLENVKQSAVFSILTIPSNVSEMSANLKAPIVINLREQVAKQVVLQENEYEIRHLMFKELKSHLMAIASQRGTPSAPAHQEILEPTANIVAIKDIPPSLTVRSLNL